MRLRPTEKDFINIHSHKRAKSQDEFVLRNAYHPEKNIRFDKILYPISVGYHPWFSSSFTVHSVERLTQLINLKQVLAIGEIGLDRANGPNLDEQQKAFEAQLALAERFNIPVIIHAVKTYSDLFPYLKKSSIPWIFHAFHASETQTSQLLKQENSYFSFGESLMKQIKFQELFKKIPLSRIFLETDISNIAIQEIYQQAAILKEIEMTELKKQLFYNFEAIFNSVKS
ncbi:MAG: TatD family hydrolase [Sphingobacteriales bacterium]|nr:TatD family hydrolase [Sphingobacteriales bacterium]